MFKYILISFTTLYFTVFLIIYFFSVERQNFIFYTGITVYNCLGLDKSLFFGEKKKLLSKTMKIMEQHYPERTFKIKILNAPGWFNWIAWPIVSKSKSDAGAM